MTPRPQHTSTVTGTGVAGGGAGSGLGGLNFDEPQQASGPPGYAKRVGVRTLASRGVSTYTGYSKRYQPQPRYSFSTKKKTTKDGIVTSSNKF